MMTANMDRLVAAKWVAPAGLTLKEIDLINGLSHQEIDALLGADTRLDTPFDPEERTFRVLF